jgi:hypothetical protein
VYSSLDPEATRFVTKHGETSLHGKVCVKYMGSVGGEWPTPQVPTSWAPPHHFDIVTSLRHHYITSHRFDPITLATLRYRNINVMATTVSDIFVLVCGQRGHWFPNKGDVQAFRTKLNALCPFTDNKQQVRHDET